MPSFHDVLPDLARDIESALLHIGRGDIVDQLREVSIGRWTYDEFADTASLHVTPPQVPNARSPRARAETISVYDELGVLLETDGEGRLAVIEVAGGKHIVARLEAAHQSGKAGKP
jgi:hypothetical protein